MAFSMLDFHREQEILDSHNALNSDEAAECEYELTHNYLNSENRFTVFKDLSDRAFTPFDRFAEYIINDDQIIEAVLSLADPTDNEQNNIKNSVSLIQTRLFEYAENMAKEKLNITE